MKTTTHVTFDLLLECIDLHSHILRLHSATKLEREPQHSLLPKQLIYYQDKSAYSTRTFEKKYQYRARRECPHRVWALSGSTSFALPRSLCVSICSAHYREDES